MDALLVVIIAMGVVLLVVTSYMEWIGLMNLFTTRCAPRYGECGHVRVMRTGSFESCWRCRHVTITHPSRLIHH
jgi:hypothetical protein